MSLDSATTQFFGSLDKPGLDLRKPLHILNRLRDVPYLVRINQKHRPRVLSVDAAQARGFLFLRQVSRVANDGAGDLPAVEVRLNAGGRPSS